MISPEIIMLFGVWIAGIVLGWILRDYRGEKANG